MRFYYPPTNQLPGLQNFTAIAYQKTVKPKQEATVAYSFMPADAFAGRPIGLSINLAYRDALKIT